MLGVPLSGLIIHQPACLRTHQCGATCRRQDALPPAYPSGRLKTALWHPCHWLHASADARRRLAGTKMVFAGLKKPEERADLIAYLKDSTK